MADYSFIDQHRDMMYRSPLGPQFDKTAEFFIEQDLARDRAARPAKPKPRRPWWAFWR